MKLKKIEINSNSRVNGKPVITVSKSGKISLSPKLREKVGYEPEDKINFFQDEDSLKDWYFNLSKEEGTPLRESKVEKYTSVFIQKAGLADTMRKVFNADKALTFSVGVSSEVEGVIYWPLLFNK